MRVKNVYNSIFTIKQYIFFFLSSFDTLIPKSLELLKEESSLDGKIFWLPKGEGANSLY